METAEGRQKLGGEIRPKSGPQRLKSHLLGEHFLMGKLFSGAETQITRKWQRQQADFPPNPNNPLTHGAR